MFGPHPLGNITVYHANIPHPSQHFWDFILDDLPIFPLYISIVYTKSQFVVVKYTQLDRDTYQVVYSHLPYILITMRWYLHQPINSHRSYMQN